MSRGAQAREVRWQVTDFRHTAFRLHDRYERDCTIRTTSEGYTPYKSRFCSTRNGMLQYYTGRVFLARVLVLSTAPTSVGIK